MSFRNLETWNDLGTSMSSSFAIPRTESTHHRLYEFAKLALIKIFVHPYATVCAFFLYLCFYIVHTLYIYIW